MESNGLQIAEGGALYHRSLIEKQIFNMSTEDKLKNVSPTFGNTVLPAVFLRELADLMKKHNATIEIERVYENEYESHAELSFKVNERYLDDLFSASGTFNSISADDIYKRLS
jgi:hypothetical protein